MDQALDHKVRQRANEICEYCRMPQAFYRQRFPIDHVIARQHGGTTIEENLALCCPSCNRYKGPNVAGIDAVTGQLVPLFHPRKDRWNEHFHWQGARLIGLTPLGRTTIAVLNINNGKYVSTRESLIAEGVFPPAS